METIINKKLLLVSAISPVPKSSGGAVRIYNTIKELSKQFDLHLVIFKDSKYTFSKEDINFLTNNSKSWTSYDTSPNKTEQVFVDFNQPYWFSDWYSPEAIIGINQLIKKNNISTVHIELSQLLYLYDYLPEKVYKIFVAEDISTTSFLRRLGEINSLKTKIIHFFRWLEIYYYEKKYLKKYDLVAAVSEYDKKILQDKFNHKNVICIPNGIESIDFQEIKTDKNIIRLGYFGSFSHPPNKYAFIYFLNKIVPLLEKNKIKYTFYLAGKNDPTEVINLVNKSKVKNKKLIYDLGFVNEVKEFYKNIDMLVTPISSGSGSRIKILESLGLGIPVISSQIGAEGNNIVSTYLKIANNESEFVEQIVLTHKQLLNKSLFSHQTNLKTQIQSQLWSSIISTYAKIIVNINIYK